jgi:hypothetical protein
MPKQLMDSDLHFKSGITVFLIHWEIGFRDERDFLVRSLSTEDISK